MKDNRIFWALLLLVVFFLAFGTDAEASVITDVSQYGASYSCDELYFIDPPARTRTYNFYIGADGISVNGGSYVSYASGTADFSFDTGPLYEFKCVNEEMVYDFYVLIAHTAFNASLTYTDNDLDSFQTVLFHLKPYVMVEGQKYYITNNYTNLLNLDGVTETVIPYFGAEVSCIISYDASAVNTTSLQTLFSTAQVNVSFDSVTAGLYGYKYISSGENAIVDAIGSLSDSLVQNTTVEFDKEKADALKESINTTLAKKESAESSFRDGAVENLNSFTIPADGFTGFGAEFVSAINLCSSMLQSIYASAGNFGVLVSIAFAITISAMVLGLFRFMR